MAILGIKKNIKKKAEKAQSKEVIVAEKINKENATLSGFSDNSANSSILRPRITEKSGDASQKLNAYTFEISRSTSKNEVAKAIKELYKVTPLRINVINLPRKRILSRGKKGWSGGVKKAVVYLKEGDKIEFI